MILFSKFEKSSNKKVEVIHSDKDMINQEGFSWKEKENVMFFSKEKPKEKKVPTVKADLNFDIWFKSYGFFKKQQLKSKLDGQLPLVYNGPRTYLFHRPLPNSTWRLSAH